MLAGLGIFVTQAVCTAMLRAFGSMLGILYTFCGMRFLLFMLKGSFVLPRVMSAK